MAPVTWYQVPCQLATVGQLQMEKRQRTDIFMSDLNCMSACCTFLCTEYCDKYKNLLVSSVPVVVNFYLQNRGTIA